jgi:SSS family solute:Na+ symporter
MMSTLTGIDYLIILISLAATLWLGFAMQKKASAGISAYLLGDRNIPWWALGASGMAANIDVSGTMVIVALIYALGAKALYIGIRGDVVLVMAFFMVFMGKWSRRAGVMTMAEWMTFRFGIGKEGQTARALAAVSQIVVHIWLISYFAVGGGKFLAELMGLSGMYYGITAAQLSSILLIGLGLIYTLVSGFYGVVWTDVLQGGFILCSIVYVVFKAMMLVEIPNEFLVSLPAGKDFVPFLNQYESWSSIWPVGELSLPDASDYSNYNLFGITVGFYVVKTVIEGLGGAGGYMGQRYFAAKSDREAGLLSLVWIFLLSFRWPLVTAFALLALDYSSKFGGISDPELILPAIINTYIPVGFKGLVVSSFLAAALSTFTSIINAGSAYWSKDIYQAFISKEASEKSLVFQSRLASLFIVVLGVAFSFPIVNVNDLFGWLTLAFGPSLFIPLVLRWYWWRFNGWGFAWGTFLGMVGAVGVRFVDVGPLMTYIKSMHLLEAWNLLVPSLLSLTGAIFGSMLTAPTDKDVLRKFYFKTKPFGFWGQIHDELPSQDQLEIKKESKRDIVGILLAVPWQMALFMTGILFVMRRWDHFSIALSLSVVLTVGLYFTWYKHLADTTTEKAT